MGKINSILRSKGKEIISVTPSTIVYDAIELMCDKNVSAVMVIENDVVSGIFTERDYARKLILKGRASKETVIGEVMTKELITVTPESSVEDCMRLMSGKFIRHLPVMENDRIVGIISIGDVVRQIIQDQKFIIANMESYISGS